jgi:hypothetical protein
MQNWVLACFDPWWPVLNYAVAHFQFALTLSACKLSKV